MRSSEYTRDYSGERRPSGLAGLLAGFGEEVAAEPENLEEALGRLVRAARVLFETSTIELSATIGESRTISVADSSSGVATSAGGLIEEFPISRGKTTIGVLRFHGAVGRREELRAVAAVVGLALDAAHARELAAQRAAQGSAVQIASEALGAILDERDLYSTVLVLTLELLEASGGAVLLEDGGVVSLGFDDAGETLVALGRIGLGDRGPWVGRVGRFHALGVELGQAGGAVFFVREQRPYSEAEGVSLKLVARQFARARERSRLYASLEQTTLDVISALAAALESRDDTTGEHIMRTQNLAGAVARELGFAPEEIRAAQYAAALHDVGKIGIPDAILNKPGKLTEEEWTFMRRHPEMGADIVGRISGFDEVTAAVLAHHERYDGRGYPAGLAGTTIPASARLIFAIDAYDAMTNDRPYRRALTHEQALSELEAGAGSQFDPEVVEALKTVLLERRRSKEEEPGS